MLRRCAYEPCRRLFTVPASGTAGRSRRFCPGNACRVAEWRWRTQAHLTVTPSMRAALADAFDRRSA